MLAGSRYTDAKLVVAQRYITRSTRPGCEPHVPLSPAEFSAYEGAGKFLFSWRAYEFSYGVSRTVLSDVSAGWHVLVNGSRRYLEKAREIYPDLLPVCLLVGPDVLESRLLSRGRETAVEISARLRRAHQFADMLPADAILIRNDGRIEEVVGQLLNLLEYEVPPGIR